MFVVGSTCRRMRRMLSDRVDGVLSERETRRVDEHLRSCPSCREEYRFLRELVETASALEYHKAPDYLWERINLQLDEHPWGGEDPAEGPEPGWRGLLVPNINFAGLACICALIAILCLLPGPAGDDSGYIDENTALAQEYSSNIEYVSLYMMANADQFPPEIQQYYMNQLMSLDQKIRMIKTTLDRFPENRRAQAELAATYGHKLAIYKKLGFTSGDESLPDGGDFLLKRDVRYD